MRRLLIIFSLFLLSASNAYMQNEAKWPPNPADIFVLGIEVLNFEMLDKVQQSPLGEIAIIPEYHVIKGADGRVYPWPESIPYFQFTYPGPIVIYDNLYLYKKRGLESDIDAIWTLNLKTGFFAEYVAHEEPDTPCGKVWPKRMGWDLYRINNQVYLCNQPTGQKILFPQGYELAFTTPDKPFVLDMPDNHLLFVGKAQQTNEFAVFVHNPITQVLDIVGKLPLGEHIYYEMQSPDILLIEVDDTSTTHTDRQYGILHLSETSLTLYEPPINDSSIVTRWNFWPNPNLAIYSSLPNGTCNVVLYDLVTNQEQSFEFSDLCDADYTDADGTGYYREISADKKTATVIRFNPVTKERKELYTGEVEGVQWVSKDDRYLILIIDDSGQIDLIPGVYVGPNTSGEGTLKLIDTQYGIVGFKAHAFIDYTAAGWTPHVTSIAPNWLAIRYTGYDMENESLVMRLSPDGITTHKILVEYRINDEWATYSDEQAFGLYHIEDERRIPIFKTPIKVNYVVNSLTPLDDGRFEVGVSYSNWPKEDPPDQKTALFIINISNLDLPIKQNILHYAISSDEGAY